MYIATKRIATSTVTKTITVRWTGRATSSGTSDAEEGVIAVKGDGGIGGGVVTLDMLLCPENISFAETPAPTRNTSVESKEEYSMNFLFVQSVEAIKEGYQCSKLREVD